MKIAATGPIFYCQHFRECPTPLVKMRISLLPDFERTLDWHLTRTIIALLGTMEFDHRTAPRKNVCATGLVANETVGAVRPPRSLAEKQLEVLGEYDIEITPLELAEADRRLALRREKALNPDIAIRIVLHSVSTEPGRSCAQTFFHLSCYFSPVACSLVSEGSFRRILPADKATPKVFGHPPCHAYDPELGRSRG